MRPCGTRRPSPRSGSILSRWRSSGARFSRVRPAYTGRGFGRCTCSSAGVTATAFSAESVSGSKVFVFMSPQRLNILYVSQMPASPPRFGAQARIHGLMTQLARRHNLTAAMLVDEEFDVDECRRAMQAYCGEVV